tara:strand:- start:293 stop:1333 length:1041 start_codon:yes stop_codon:yes gene_type:complete
MKYKLSVIIPFYFSNNKTIDPKKYFSLSSFEKCLSAVFKSDYNNFEVIAVSDSSSQESIDIARKYPCKLVKLKKNSGAGFARNKGADLAKGKILVFVDSDVEIQIDALSIINKHFNKKNNHGLLQGIYSHKPNYKNSSNQYLQSYYSYYLFTETKKNKFTETLCTNIFAIKKDIFKENDGFDNQFSSATTEDQEFGFRLIKKGFKIPIERKLTTIHHASSNIWDFITKITNTQICEMKMHLRNKTIFMRTQQSNYTNVLLGMVLVSLMIAISFLNIFIQIPFFLNILVGLNIIFIGIHLNFLKFILISKGSLASLKGVFYVYLHRLLHINCALTGIIDFYLFGKKY